MAVTDPTRRPRWRMPVDVKKALSRSGLMESYEARPPYQRNDYLGWIAAAKREGTKAKRVAQMLSELRSGKAYMGMSWKAGGSAAGKAVAGEKPPAAKKRSASPSSANPVDAYIASFTGERRAKLEEMRALVRTVAKDAEERMAYGMPGYYLDGPLVYFAAAKGHIGLYPTPSGIEAFDEELAPYRRSKGAVQFPYGEKLPAALIKRIVKHRIAENSRKAEE